ncbi:MAG: hypothetical protein U9N09_04020 [Euryarchaeota archaeon]|nr:hypothetical protein [Euryarchaeota archaeon]
MKHASTLLALLLIITSVNTAAALLIVEAGEISYQVPRADRIVVGTVTDIQSFYNHRVVTIEVGEWLDSPLPAKAITVRTEGGTNSWVEDAASFALNETAILMLEDVDASENRFRIVCAVRTTRHVALGSGVLEGGCHRTGARESRRTRYCGRRGEPHQNPNRP